MRRKNGFFSVPLTPNMHFSEIIGQIDVVERLISEVESRHLPHALLLSGNEGNGGMAIALALADKLLAVSESGKAMINKLQHPDLHFAFPIFKKQSGKDIVSDHFIKEWRDMLLSNPYFGYQEWMDACGAENQQLVIYEAESDNLTKKLSLKASQGGWRVVIIWLPEKMNRECANKLLKLLEEPPAGVVFVMVSEHPEQLLETIRSRVQTIEVPKLKEEDVKEALIEKYHIIDTQAAIIAKTCNGNMTAALRCITDDSVMEMYFDLFVELMRLSYARRVKEMRKWSEKVTGLGRERQKNFLDYCQRMLRENFIYNFHHNEIVYMNEREQNFAVKFAPFINENNVIGIMEELSLCQRDIAQNANPKIVFFDFALKMIVLIKNR